MTTTPAQDLTAALEKIPEVDQHERIYRPLLVALGAKHVKNVHGPREFGRDFVFIEDANLLSDPILAVCQIKNGKLSNREATEVLAQLCQAREIEITNPSSQLKELPKKVYLFSTHDLPDLPDAGPLLKKVREAAEICTGQRLAELMLEKIPTICLEIVNPGARLQVAIQDLVATHHEANVFNLPETKAIKDFFLNLGLGGLIQAGGVPVKKTGPSGNVLTEWLFADVGVPLIKASKAVSASFSTPSPIPVKGDPRQIQNGKVKVDYSELANFGVFLGDHLNGSDCSASLAWWLAFTSKLERLNRCLDEAGVLSIWNALDSATRDQLQRFSIAAVSPSELLASGRDFLIAADAGSGKTCLARMIVAEALGRGHRALFFPCLRLEDESKSIEQHLVDYLQQLTPDEDVSSCTEYVRSAQIVAIDACDESPIFGPKIGSMIEAFLRPQGVSITIKPTNSGISFRNIPGKVEAIEVKTLGNGKVRLTLLQRLSEEEIEQLKERNEGSAFEIALDQLMNVYASTKSPQVIITSRTSSSLELKSKVCELSLEEFTDDQVRLYFERMLPGDKAEEVKSLIASDTGLLEICKTPMTATIVVALAVNDYDLPRSRTEVYKKRFELLLERWDRLRNVPKRTRVSPTDKLQFLQELAYFLHQKHQRRFTEGEASLVWNQHFNRSKVQVKMGPFLDELISVDNAIVREDAATFSLGHLSFQEYLCASAIVYKQQGNKLASRASDQWWQNVCVFFVGITNNAETLINQIAESSPLDQRQFLKRLLAEARHTPPRMQQLISDLMQESAD